VSLFATAEGRRAGRLLEFAEVLRQIAAWALTQRGRELVLALEPTADEEALAGLWAHVEELTRLLEDSDDLPLGEMSDLDAVLGDRRSHTGPLDPPELAQIGAACVVLSQVLEAAAERAARLPRTAKLLEGCVSPRGLADQLSSALEPDGRLKDSASPRLASLRKAIVAAQGRVREAARREMARAVQQGWTDAPELVVRGDHHCVPVMARHRRSLPGIIHDRSDTGVTLFIEPIAVVEAANALQQVRLLAHEEERRIVAALNAAVADRAPQVVELHQRVAILDAVRARAVWGRRHAGHRPDRRAPGSGVLQLQGFRHPLLRAGLAAAGREGDLVPLDLELRPGDWVLLVSGPNAGGKTVAMKAVGLAVLMAQSGIPLPARTPPRLSVFSRVLMDLGDEQSIADALSSFSAHVTHLRGILELADASSLVLLDEVGGGTDPAEGVALARATLEELAARGATTLATTHYGQLKAMVEATSGFRSASMDFDADLLRPRFRLLLDVPGSSHALAIAERMGLSAQLLARARALLGDEALRLDALLRDMERQRGELSKAREETAEALDRARAARTEYEAMAHELRRTRRERLDEAQRQAEGIVRGARARIERLLADLRRAGESSSPAASAQSPAVAPTAPTPDPRTVAERARDEVDALARQLGRELEGRAQRGRGPLPRVVVGEVVRHRGLGRAGRIVEVRDGRVLLDVGGRRIVAGPADLIAPEAEEISQLPLAPADGRVRTQLDVPSAAEASTVDVRGMVVEDAWEAVDRAVDRCLTAGLARLEVIHGKGTGRLRRALLERLRRDPRVAAATLGAEGTDDDGVTLVRL
jgi:DNA mismatch repair protein MutS2